MVRTHGLTVLMLIVCWPGDSQSSATAPAEAAVRGELAAVQAEIAATQDEDAKYTAGLVKSLVQSRLAILGQTQAMLEQKLASLRFGTQVRYTVDGKPFTLPDSAPQMLAEVEKELAASDVKIKRQEAEVARYSGGLTQAIAVSTLETLRQTHAMLEQKRVALKFGLPQYIGFNNAGGGNPPTATPAPTTSDSTKPVSGRSLEADEVKSTIALSVVDKGFIPAAPASNRYEALVTIKCSYENTSAKDVRAFTGTIIFQDLFEKEIYRANITISAIKQPPFPPRPAPPTPR